MIDKKRIVMAALVCATSSTAIAATALRFGPEINVSQTGTPTEKAKVVRLAYRDAGVFKKAWLLTYGDGPAGRENIYARYSFDDGTTWSTPVLLSRDAAGAATGGQTIAARDSLAFAADNDKPSVFAPPVTSGPLVVIVWNSAYCPADPSAGTAGSYSNPLQGAGDFDGDGTPDRPFHCIWTATTTDPQLATWNVHQLTTGERDAINEVVAGSSAGNAFALVWQEDPAGLQPGEAEGRGDGGMGSHVTGGTNIWYTHAPTADGLVLRANIAQLSDNNAAGTGLPGASRPNLQMSGSTAVVAYEETACVGGNGGKCIVYHAFSYASHDTNAAGSVVSDPARHARRARVTLQGAAAAGASPLRTVLLWRESPIAYAAAPADIVVRRGLVDTVARPGSTGFLAADVLADAPQSMTRVAGSGGNANAHRAVLRGGFVGVAYDVTPNMDAANPEKTANPTANYNLYFTRSLASGDPGSWSAARNLSSIESPALTVVEPRLVPTPGTIVNPLTGVADPHDTQNADVVYVAYATERNDATNASGRVYLSRSTDQGATFEPFVPVSATLAGQSEAQLRPMPDGSSTMALWMGERTAGDASTKEAMFGVGNAIELPDLNVAASARALTVGSLSTVTVVVHNHGTGIASNVVLHGTLANGLSAAGISEPSVCTATQADFRCTFPRIDVDTSLVVSVAVGGASAGLYDVVASAESDVLDADTADNATSVAVTVAEKPADPPPPPPPVTPAAPSTSGGCTLGRADAPFDPVLLLLAGLALIATTRRRNRGDQEPV